jgi:hypothetical protein
MPRGDKSAYTAKQKRQAEHIEESYESRGVTPREAKRRAWATENKISGGGRKKASGKRRKTKSSTAQGRKKSTRATRSKTSGRRSRS